MTSRRVPLAHLQNAANSPLRPASTVVGKRQRSHASEQRDLPYGQPPPAKKLIVEVDDAESRRYGLGRRSNAPPTALQKKLEAARESKPAPKPTTRSQKAPSDAQNMETIRQWQKHYKKMFPNFTFYFESLPEDIRAKILRRTAALGARDVKFFSRDVTHVVTTRPIPPELDPSSTASASQAHGSRTVNPAAVERARSVFDVALQKGHNGDILYKAREMGIKIWTAEKLERMLNTMFDTNTGEEPQEYGNTRRLLAPGESKTSKQADLSKLLQHEKLNGPADRDYAAPNQDTVELRGFYIYIHDMDEMYRPCMVREYPKVAHKEDGKWPQFRITGPGKCPFVEDPNWNHARRVQQQEEEQRRNMERAAPRTRAATAMEATQAAEKHILNENNNLARRTRAATQEAAQQGVKQLDNTRMNPPKQAATDGAPPMFGSAQASLRAIPRFAGGEPVASGIQPSNVTSAIRSQMISSTAAAPGARVGPSKEVNQLKRKVLEKNSVPSFTSGQSMNDMRAALNQENGPPTRAAKRKAQETLGLIHEEDGVVGEERAARRTTVVRRKKVEKELKPGYCENCREKFNDFDEHILSRKHRKFATNPENWRELDELLTYLVRK